VVVTPVQAPNANAHAEHWIRTVWAECLDWLLIVGRGHLEQVLRVYVQHDNAHRAYRALGLQPPDPAVGLTLTGLDQPPESTDATSLVACFTSTDKLHERISALYEILPRVTEGIPRDASLPWRGLRPPPGRADRHRPVTQRTGPSGPPFAALGPDRCGRHHRRTLPA
jgi:hypothetical protein